jgi:hypothetical protein
VRTSVCAPRRAGRRSWSRPRLAIPRLCRAFSKTGPTPASKRPPVNRPGGPPSPTPHRPGR